MRPFAPCLHNRPSALAGRAAFLALLFLCLLLAALPSLSSAAGPDPDALVGSWVVAEKDAHIEIYRQGDRYFGRISWLREEGPPSPENKAPPESKMHEKPRIGLLIVRDFKFEGEAWKGTLYDPSDGKSYRGIMTLASPDELHVRGYLGISLFGRTTIWHRVPASAAP